MWSPAACTCLLFSPSARCNNFDNALCRELRDRHGVSGRTVQERRVSFIGRNRTCMMGVRGCDWDRGRRAETKLQSLSNFAIITKSVYYFIFTATLLRAQVAKM